VCAFNFRRGSDQRLVYRKEFNGQLFKETERIRGLGGPDASLDDIVELSPVDPS